MAKAERGLHCTRIERGLPVTAEERLSVHLASERRFSPLIIARGRVGKGKPAFASNWKEVVEAWVDCVDDCQETEEAIERWQWEKVHWFERLKKTQEQWMQLWGMEKCGDWDIMYIKHEEQLRQEIEEWLMGQATREQWVRQWGVESGAGCVEIYKKHREQLRREAAEWDVRQPETREQPEQHWVAMYRRHKEELRRETAEWRMLEQETREQVEIYERSEQQLDKDLMRQREIRKQWKQRWGVEREERAGWVEICKKHAHCVYHEWKGLLAPGGGTGVPKLITRSLKHGLMPHKDAMAWMLAWKAGPGWHFADSYAERWITKPWDNLWDDDDWNTADAVGEGHECNDGCGRWCPGRRDAQDKHKRWISSRGAMPWCQKWHLEMSCPVQYPAPCAYRQEAVLCFGCLLVGLIGVPVEVVNDICACTMLGFSQTGVEEIFDLSSEGEVEIEQELYLEREGDYVWRVGCGLESPFANMSVAIDSASSGDEEIRGRIRGSRGGTVLQLRHDALE